MKSYKNEDITVTWEPDVCIHSKKCFTQLISVFDPRKKPWITLSGANTDDITKAIDNCPSQALKYFRNSLEHSNPVETIPQNEDKTTIQLLKDEPEEKKDSNLKS